MWGGERLGGQAVVRPTFHIRAVKLALLLSRSRALTAAQ